jgi:threonine/homoserine/homoserine lactone efflux protein
MSIESYLLFIGAGLVLILVPGPDMIYLLSRCIAQGRRAGVLAALGINAGGYVHLTAAITGLSAILMTSAVAFTAVKWAGAAYLVYLGVGALRSRSGPISLSTNGLTGQSARAIFWQGFISDVLNPKVAVFFLALLPQFVHAQGEGVIGQLLLLGLTLNVMAISVNLVLVLISTRITEGLRRNNSIARWLQKAMGITFIGLGARLALDKP